MGFLLPALTQAKLDNQRDVVRNERRQNYEMRPYGEVRGAQATAMWPEDHPYRRLTIGSHEDLEAATLEDVRSFFKTWYGPNNATLAVVGDFETEQAKAWIEQLFGTIERTFTPRTMERQVSINVDTPQRFSLEQTEDVYREVAELLDARREELQISDVVYRFDRGSGRSRGGC